MQAGLWMALVGLAMGMGALYLRERIRFQNYQAGQPFRDWIIEHAPAVLFDPDAASGSQFAASMMLSCVYDRKNIRKLAPSKDGVQSGLAEYDDIKPLVKGHERFVEDGINNLVAITILENTFRGLAFRILITRTSSDPVGAFARFRTKANWAKNALNVNVVPADTMDAIGHLPDGSSVREEFKHKISLGAQSDMREAF